MSEAEKLEAMRLFVVKTVIPLRQKQRDAVETLELALAALASPYPDGTPRLETVRGLSERALRELHRSIEKLTSMLDETAELVRRLEGMD